MPVLEVQNLKMYYEIPFRGYVRAVDDISFTLEKGESLGIVGESGCGKSSLAISLMNLLPKNAKVFGGKVLLNGRNIFEVPDEELRKEIRWKQISMIFQGAMNALHPIIKVGDQIVEAITLHEDVSKEEAWKRAEDLLEMVGIDRTRAHHYPFEFSGGMRQRAMIAMALALNPDVLLADEPTTALDVIVQAQILKLIKDLQRKFGIALVLISHDVSVIAEMSDKVAVMYAGMFQEYGSAEDVFLRPMHPYTKGLLAGVPSVKGKPRRLKSIPGAPPNLLNPPKGCRFHPRCPFAVDKCREELPPLVEVEPGHFVRCHRAEELKEVPWDVSE